MTSLHQIETVALQVAHYHLDSRFALFPSLRNNFDVLARVEQMTTDTVLSFRTKALSGEIIEEQKRVEHEYRFDVFRSWVDHLKYDIKEGRFLTWIPRWIKRRILVINYQTVIKKRSDLVPVSVTRMCPHADRKFDMNESHYHVAFLRHPNNGKINA